MDDADLTLQGRNSFRLLAKDAEDLAVLSSCLQDAVLPIADMLYDAGANRFTLAVSRFCWEKAVAADCTTHERVLSGFSVDGVEAVQYRGLDPRDRGRVLVLLALRATEGGLQLDFAGGAALRLRAPQWVCRMKDVGLPWPAGGCPEHDC